MIKISRDQFILAMSPNHTAVEYANSGDHIVFETCDCFSNKIQKEDHLFSSVGWDSINPATGPLYIHDAEPGDILKVDILEIRISEKGVMTTAPRFGVFGEIIPEERTKIIPIRDGKAIFSEKLDIPIQPMIGVIGTAPKGEEIPNGTPGFHGGNMDCKRIVKGSTLYLPVNVPGALLAMGDLHAVMADGEVVICGLEIPGEVTIAVTVLKKEQLPLPMLVEGEHVMTIASAATLDEAAKMASLHMHAFLMDKVGLDLHEAGMLLSLVGELKICQVVDPLMTARMEVPRWVLEKYNYRLE